MNTHEMYEKITPFNLRRKGLSDLTGDLPHKSSIGNLYVMVLYDYDINTILAETIKIGRHQPSTMLSSISKRSSKQEVAMQKFTLWTTSVIMT